MNKLCCHFSGFESTKTFVVVPNMMRMIVFFFASARQQTENSLAQEKKRQRDYWSLAGRS